MIHVAPNIDVLSVTPSTLVTAPTDQDLRGPVQQQGTSLRPLAALAEPAAAHPCATARYRAGRAQHQLFGYASKHGTWTSSGCPLRRATIASMPARNDPTRLQVDEIVEALQAAGIERSRVEAALERYLAAKMAAKPRRELRSHIIAMLVAYKRANGQDVSDSNIEGWHEELAAHAWSVITGVSQVSGRTSIEQGAADLAALVVVNYAAYGDELDVAERSALAAAGYTDQVLITRCRESLVQSHVRRGQDPTAADAAFADITELDQVYQMLDDWDAEGIIPSTFDGVIAGLHVVGVELPPLVPTEYGLAYPRDKDDLGELAELPPATIEWVAVGDGLRRESPETPSDAVPIRAEGPVQLSGHAGTVDDLLNAVQRPAARGRGTPTVLLERLSRGFRAPSETLRTAPGFQAATAAFLSLTRPVAETNLTAGQWPGFVRLAEAVVAYSLEHPARNPMRPAVDLLRLGVVPVVDGSSLRAYAGGTVIASVELQRRGL